MSFTEYDYKRLRTMPLDLLYPIIVDALSSEKTSKGDLSMFDFNDIKRGIKILYGVEVSTLDEAIDVIHPEWRYKIDISQEERERESDELFDQMMGIRQETPRRRNIFGEESDEDYD